MGETKAIYTMLYITGASGKHREMESSCFAKEMCQFSGSMSILIDWSKGTELDNVGITIINNKPSPQSSPQIGGMVTIPRHGWFYNPKNHAKPRCVFQMWN